MISKIACDLSHQLKQLIKQSIKIVIIPHHNPDGDAAGAALSLCRVLKNAGKDAKVIVPNSFPDFLSFIHGANKVINYENENQKAKQLIMEAELLFFLDFNDFKRINELGSVVETSEAKKVMIDHHPFPEMEVDVMISDTSVSSTCELIYEVIESAELLSNLDKEAAEAMYTGIMTDTGNFGYNSSNPQTFKIVGELLSFGIDKDRIHSNVYHNFSHSRWKLLGHCLLNKMVVLGEFKTAYIAISDKELKEFDFKPGDTEGFVNYPLNIKGIVFCALFIEKEDKIKTSFRSKGSFAANKFSGKYFNGGGHNNAAGGESYLSLDETVRLFVSKLPLYVDEINQSF